jgi:outer membrane receptor protein involved in Fe transport
MFFLSPDAISVFLLVGLFPVDPAEGIVTGVVRDQLGFAIPSAQVRVIDRSDGSEQRTVRTDQGGRFRVVLPPGTYVLHVLADGFGEQIEQITLSPTDDVTLTITLPIAPLTENMVVTPGRIEQKLGDLPVQVTTLRRGAVERSTALVVDDLLRQVPTFSLFRRSSSLVSHPTTHGVSLRGIGPSGVSRTLVLVDNAPYTDPFGGWVAWSGIPLEVVERVEIVPSNGSHLYGSSASGGIIHIFTRSAAPRSARVTTQVGSHETGTLDGWVSDVFGRFAFSLAGSYLSTDGYVTVAPAERGAIDTTANAKYGTAMLTLEYSRARQRFFLRGHFLDEHRRNGTHLQRNSTLAKLLTAGATGETAEGHQWQALTSVHLKRFHSTFTQISPDRSREQVTLFQRVPTTSVTVSLLWSQRLKARHRVSGGADLRWIEGHSQELVPAPTGLIRTQRVAGGIQRFGGFFLQDHILATEQLSLMLTARFDHWRNTKAVSRETVLATDQAIERRFPDKSNNLVSPRLGILYRVTDRTAVWAATAGGFRAPTLNELYRQFRVGNVLTLANDRLGPERLLSGEGGLRYVRGENVFVRVTGFWNRVTGAVSNVTVNVTPTLITQQRQNLGRTRIRGIEADVEYRPTRRWRWIASYFYDDATIRESAAMRQIEGNRLPQVPAHRFTIQAEYSHPSGYSFFWQGRFVGTQFDDDQNRFTLERFFLTDVSLSRSWRRGIDVFVNVENLLDATYAVGKTPFTTIGGPRRVRMGIRLSVSPP